MTRSGGAGRAKPPAARAKPPKTKTQTTNEGRWTDEEHRKFLEAYDDMIAVDPARRRWPNVAAAVGTRSTTQCRSHAQKYFTVRKSTSASGQPGGIIYYSGRLDAARLRVARGVTLRLTYPRERLFPHRSARSWF